MRTKVAESTEIGGEVPNSIGGFTPPYRVSVTIEGVADILFHRWTPEAVIQKSAAAKNSIEKKTDNVESYVYRNAAGEICIPGIYLRGAIINAAKFRQDPRSPRKSAMDLYRAAVVPLSDASLGTDRWDYSDTRRVVVQRNGVNRTRPAFKAGWRGTFEFLVTLPEYVSPQDLNEMIQMAGRVIGVADFRPTYGRFVVTNYTVLD